jgi:branched-chain amino acid aminotransferase
LWTPPLNADVFPGITREVLLEIARSKGLDVRVSNIKQSDLDTIDGAFLCSTLMEIRGIFKLGQRALHTTELSAYRTLVSAFRSITHQCP